MIVSGRNKLLISSILYRTNHIDTARHSASFRAIQKSGKGGLDAFVAEISVNGVWNWVLDAGGDGNDIPSDLEINDDGLISISGYYSAHIACSKV